MRLQQTHFPICWAILKTAFLVTAVFLPYTFNYPFHLTYVIFTIGNETVSPFLLFTSFNRDPLGIPWCFDFAAGLCANLSGSLSLSITHFSGGQGTEKIMFSLSNTANKSASRKFHRPFPGHCIVLYNICFTSDIPTVHLYKYKETQINEYYSVHQILTLPRTRDLRRDK